MIFRVTGIRNVDGMTNISSIFRTNKEKGKNVWAVSFARRTNYGVDRLIDVFRHSKFEWEGQEGAFILEGKRGEQRGGMERELEFGKGGKKRGERKKKGREREVLRGIEKHGGEVLKDWMGKFGCIVNGRWKVVNGTKAGIVFRWGVCPISNISDRSRFRSHQKLTSLNESGYVI
jgi:hypothetical protein